MRGTSPIDLLAALGDYLDPARANPRLREVPVIAVADDVSDLTQTLARQDGCAAVCLTTCSSTALASGIHAVLDCRQR
jgi:hypothetical protein